MTGHFADRLLGACRAKGNALCVGLDPRWDLLPHAIRTSASLYGVEGFHLKDVVGVAMVSIPSAFTTKPMVADVEIGGELTRGMTVFDQRWTCTAKPNVDMAMAIDLAVVRKYINDTLSLGNHTPRPE